MELAGALLKMLTHIEFIEERILNEENETDEHLEELIAISKNILNELQLLNKNLTPPVAVNATISFGTPTNK